MKISVNEKDLEIERPVTLKELAGRYKPGADLYILDGGIADASHMVSEGARVVLIKKGERPSGKELADLLCARHTPGVYDAMQRACVGVAGLGGLGSSVCVSLVRMGLGKLKGYDYDIVEPSNINRQNYFLDQIGMKKCDALADTLARISPLTDVDLKDMTVNGNNAAALFDGCDIVIEAFDDPYAKAMLFDIWRKDFYDKYYIGASGVAGYTDDPPLAVRKIGGKGYIVGDFSTESAVGTGLMAPRTGIAANMQANIAVKLIMKEYSDENQCKR